MMHLSGVAAPVRAGLILTGAALLLAACSSQKEPAENMISDIEVAIASAGPDAVKYAPDRVSDVENRLAALKASFERREYSQVVAAAPAVLGEAVGLAQSAAARKAEVSQALDEQWTALAGALPGDMTVLADRIARLGAERRRPRAPGIDLQAANGRLSDARALWSKAQGAFGNGNMGEAVSAAKDVKEQLEDLASRLELVLPAPAASR